MRKIVFECEHCEVEIEVGDEILIYDDCYFCDFDCLKEHLLEGQIQEIQEVIA